MAAFVAGTTQAPITAMMMIFELTNYSLLLPLMTVSIIASLITMLIKKESIYTQNLIQKGVLLRSKEENDVIKSKTVKPFIRKDFHFFSANDNIEKMLMSFLGNKQHIFPVVNNSRENKLVGLISIDNLKYLIEEHVDAIGALIIAKDIMNPPEYLYIDDNLINALEIFADSDYSVLPVLNKENKLLGLLSEHKILKVYNDEYRKRKFAEAILKNSGTIDSVEGVALGNSLYIAEIKIPKELSKQKIRDIKFRNRFNLEIILVKNTKDKFFPESDYILKETDKLMILGKAKDIHSFKLTYGIKKI
jgi:CIC family chloride channel protein